MSIVFKRGGNGIHSSSDAEKIADERVSKLEGVIAQSQGEIVLLHRNVYGGSKHTGGCYGGTVSEYLSTYDLGIVNGGLKINKNTKKSETRIIEHIPSPDMFGPSGTYYYQADFSFPLERKFESIGLIHFTADELKDIAPGEVEFERGELVPELELFIPGYARKSPFLVEFGLFAGEKEIVSFIKEDPYKILGMHFALEPDKRIQEIFKMIKDPSEAQRIIAEDLFEKRNDLTGRLLGEVTSLTHIDTQLSQIKPEVMKIGFYYERDQDGSRDMYSSKGDLYSLYLGLRREANEEMKTITSHLKEADSLGLGKEDFSISGETIGFPSKVSSKEYLSFVDVLLIPRVSAKISEMDKHLSEARKKAG